MCQGADLLQNHPACERGRGKRILLCQAVNITHCITNAQASVHSDILHQCILNKTSRVQTCCSLVSEWAPHWHGWSWDTELHSRGRGVWRWQLEGKGLHVTLVIAMIYSVWGKLSGVSSLYSHRASKLTVRRDTEGGNVTWSVQLTIQNTWKRDGCGHCNIGLLFTIQCHLSILCLLGLCDTIKISGGNRLNKNLKNCIHH